MVYRSAFLGFLIAVIVAAALLFPAGNRRLADRLDAFVRRMTERSREDTLPPALFPVFPERGEEEEQREEERTKPFAPHRERVRIVKIPKEREVTPGSKLRFSLSVENVSDEPLRMLMVQERFDDDLLTIEDAGEGAVAPNAIAWTIPELGVGEQWNATYTMMLAKGIAQGAIETTAFVSGTALEGTTSAPRLATSVVKIISLPKTGVDLPLTPR